MPVFGTVLIPGANPIVNGTNGRLLVNDAGVLGELDPATFATPQDITDALASFDNTVSVTGAAPDAELLTNPDFDGDASGWTLGAGWAYGSGNVAHTPGDVEPLTQDPGSILPNRHYRVTIVVSSQSAGSLGVEIGGSIDFDTEGISGEDGPDTFVIDIVSFDTTGLVLTPDVDYDGVIESVSVQELPAMLRLTPNVDETDAAEVVVDGLGHLWVGAPPANNPSRSLLATFTGPAGNSLNVQDVGGGMALNFLQASDFSVAAFAYGDGAFGVYLSNFGGYAWQMDGTTGVSQMPGLVLGNFVFADLPGSPQTGLEVNVTDSNTTTWGATVAGGGANNVKARYNGANWTVVGI